MVDDAPSDIEPGLAVSVISGLSLSVIRKSSDSTCTSVLVDVPDTVTVSSVSSTLSLVGVRVNVPVAFELPELSVTVNGAPVVEKSTADAVPLPATDTVTVSVEEKVESGVGLAVTVTVVAPSPSETVVSLDERRTPK